MGIGDWFKRKLAILAIATSKVEQNALGSQNNMLSDNIGQEQKMENIKLSIALKQGEVTQEVKELRWRMYKIMDKVDGMKTRIVGSEVDEAGDLRNITETYFVGNVNLDKFNVEKSDDYKLEIIVNNDEIYSSISESVENKSNIITGEISPMDMESSEKSNRIIMVNREFPPKFNIEEYTKKLLVRGISDDEKIIEFYISKYPDEYNRKTRLLISEIKKCMVNPKSSNILDITEVGFITTNSTIGAKNNKLFEYKINNFHKIIEFEGHYVIKFKANMLVNGEDIFEQYRLIELDEKYVNKEKKDIR